MNAKEIELAMRRIAAALRGRASFDLLPAGAPTCLMCKGPPAMSWWPSGKFWTCHCPSCDLEAAGAYDTHAQAIAAWTTRQARFA